jgi:hypothetical protein
VQDSLVAVVQVHQQQVEMPAVTTAALVALAHHGTRSNPTAVVAVAVVRGKQAARLAHEELVVLLAVVLVQVRLKVL